MTKSSLFADFKWSLPAGVALGTLLATFQPELYLNGWLAFSILSVLGPIFAQRAGTFVAFPVGECTLDEVLL